MIYLSICIPTYNRSSYLADTLDSIVSQPEFLNTDEIEVIISDNCSEDDTPTVVNKYVERYPDKVKYNRNPENIRDCNYERVLSLGQGQMLKLHNDTLIVNPGALKDLLEIVKECLDKGLIPFLVNGRLKLSEPVVCHSAAEFINTVSYFSTWIASFCISRAEFVKVKDFSAKADLMLTQVYVIMNLLNKGCSLLVVPEAFFTSIVPSKKGGYNLAEVFLSNYFNIIKPYFKTSNDKLIYNKERKKMLYNFFLPYMVTLHLDKISNKHKFEFKKSNYKKIIKSEFRMKDFLYFMTLMNIKISFGLGKLTLKSIIRK